MESSVGSPRLPDPIPWVFFVQEFRAKYVSDMYRETKWKQFLNLKQRNLFLVGYEKEFSNLSKYTLESVLTEAFLCRQFEYGLNESIKRYLAPVTVLQQVNFYQLVQATMKMEKFEASSRERFQKRNFLEELLPPRVKEPKSPKLSQYIVLPQGEEDKEIQKYLVLVEVLQRDQEKIQSALIAIDNI